MYGIRIGQLVALTRFIVGYTPFDYLGVPIFKGKPRSIHLQVIVDKVISKLTTWKGDIFSIMGRIQLVYSMINDMFLYSIGIYE